MGRHLRPGDMLAVSLSDQEALVLRCGLGEWSGPGSCTEEMAQALGFSGTDELWNEGERLMDLLQEGAAMRRVDWLRVVLSTEVVFMSAMMGSGLDWCITTGLSDFETMVLLRGIQAKLVGELRPLIGRGFGTRRIRWD